MMLRLAPPLRRPPAATNVRLFIARALRFYNGETIQVHDIPEWNDLAENQRANLLGQFMYNKREPLPSNIIPFVNETV